MRIVVSANGRDLDAQVSPNFGRCPYFIFVETETMACEDEPNAMAQAMGGAGIQAAQLVINRGAKAVLTGTVGPNAYTVLQAADISLFAAPAVTVRAAIKSYLAAHLAPITGPMARSDRG